MILQEFHCDKIIVITFYSGPNTLKWHGKTFDSVHHFSKSSRSIDFGNLQETKEGQMQKSLLLILKEWILLFPMFVSEKPTWNIELVAYSLTLFLKRLKVGLLLSCYELSPSGGESRVQGHFRRIKTCNHIWFWSNLELFTKGKEFPFFFGIQTLIKYSISTHVYQPDCSSNLCNWK